MTELFERGPMHIAYPKEEYQRRTQTRNRIARFFNVSPDHLAFTRGISEAFQLVISGMDWSPDDEILITNEEEPTILLPCLNLGSLCGVRTVPVPLLADAERQLRAFAERIGPRTRLIAVSHVTTDTGHRLPIEPLVRLANGNGVPIFVDTAHSAGLVALDLHGLAADFVGLLSYKWMQAPYAAGALVVRPDRIDGTKVRFAGNRAEERIDYETYTYTLKKSAQRFEYGPWSWPLIHSWAYALDYLESIGRQGIWERVTSLATQLKRGLQGIQGVTVLTPMSTELSAALIAFSIDGWSGPEIEYALRSRWNVVVRSLFAGVVGVRASVAYFTLEQEIDFLLECVAALAKERTA